MGSSRRARTSRPGVPNCESLIGRLVCVAERFDPATEHYRTAAEENEKAVRATHDLLFLQWLECSLTAQWADLRSYLRVLDCDLATWFRHKAYNRLVPPSALDAERLLFSCDFDALSALALCGSRQEHCPAALRVARILEWVSEREDVADGPGLPLKHLAPRFRFSSDRLGRLFRQYTGQTYRKYLRTIRMRRAAKLLLRDPTSTTKEVAALLGYEDTSNFSRDFRSRLGTTPGEFRRLGARLWIHEPLDDDSERSFDLRPAG